jgi:hypothetical protein
VRELQWQTVPCQGLPAREPWFGTILPNCMARALLVSLLIVTAGCFSSSSRGRVYPDEPRTLQPPSTSHDPVAGDNADHAAFGNRDADQPPKWRPVQFHVSGGPVFRSRESLVVRAVISLARVWSWPSKGQAPGALSGPFAGVGVEGTAEANQLTLGPLVRFGTGWGEYIYPGTNSPDGYAYGQVVPFVGMRDGRLVFGLRLGGGLTLPKFLRSLLRELRDTRYADEPELGIPPLSVSHSTVMGMARLLLIPVALVNHVDANVEATTSGASSASAALGSDPTELVAPLH